MPLPDTLPTVPDQSFPFQRLFNTRSLDIMLLGTSPGYDNDIDNKNQPEITIRQHDEAMYRKSKKLFDES